MNGGKKYGIWSANALIAGSFSSRNALTGLRNVWCTVENQDRADYRIPIFLSLPIKHRMVIVAPMLEQVNLRKYLNPSLIEEVSVGGESGKYARPLDFRWVLDMQAQCRESGIPFNFHQTGSYLIKDGRQYHIPREHQHSQAKKAGLNTKWKFKLKKSRKKDQI